MGKAQKIKRAITLCRACFAARLTKPDQLRLLRMNGQPKTAKPLREYSHNPANIFFQFKADNKVSRPRELPPQSLSEPGVNLSAHRAPIIQPSVLCPSSNEGTARVAFGQFYPANVPLYVDGLLTS